VSQGPSATVLVEPAVARPRTPPTSRRRVEASLTAATLALLLTSYAGHALGWPGRLLLVIHVAAYVTGGWFGIRAAAASLREGRLNIDFLMILAALGAAAIDRWHEGTTLLFLFSLSNTLQDYAMQRSRDAISGLLKLRPTQACVRRDGIESRVPIESLRAGDIMIVRPGEMLAADGVVRLGLSDLNEASITGESVPVEKGPGEPVFAGSINGEGALEVELTRAASDSTLARITQLVESAQSQKARTQRFLDTFESFYAVGVVMASALAIAVPVLLLRHPFADSFYRAMVLLVVASPCALVISTPASILSAIANGARRGVLFKGGAHLENLAETRVVAFDKTGTLTHGRLRVTDVVTAERTAPGIDADGVLAAAAALESRSEHPISHAILSAARARGLRIPDLSDFKNLPGRGVHARADGFLLWIGGERMYREHGESVPEDLLARKAELERQGKTVLVLHRELERRGSIGTHEVSGGWLGLIAVADTVRDDAAACVRRLRELGVQRVIMLTGDNPDVAAEVARQTGVDEYLADLLPEEKVDAVRRLRERYGAVLMVGDGVNDAPALAVANVGAAMGAAGSDVALETADLVLMSDDLGRIPYALELARRSRRIVWQNICFALAVIIVLIVSTFGFSLPLPLGVVGHEGSTLLVVANGLRLLAFRAR